MRITGMPITIINVNAYELRCFQYVVQKRDGTIVLLTATTDNSCYLDQLPVIEAIVSKTFIN